MINCIVIPCYNEEKRLPKECIIDFLKKEPDFSICFVNDGSSDNTLAILDKIKQMFSDRILVVDKKNNEGKAAAIFTGMNESYSWNKFKAIGYLDADLATPLYEYKRIYSYMQGDIKFVFGARVSRIGSSIKRKLYRHLIGRVFATFSSTMLGIPVYDTQCGAKIFEYSIVSTLFKDKFISTWEFDVEVFYRFIAIVGRENVEIHAREIPLDKWEDVGESKVKFTHAFKLPFELIRIYRHYKKKYSNS